MLRNMKYTGTGIQHLSWSLPTNPCDIESGVPVAITFTAENGYLIQDMQSRDSVKDTQIYNNPKENVVTKVFDENKLKVDGKRNWEFRFVIVKNPDITTEPQPVRTATIKGTGFTSDKTFPVDLMENENLVFVTTAKAGKLIDTVTIYGINGIIIKKVKGINSKTYNFDEQAITGEIRDGNLSITISVIDEPTEPKPVRTATITGTGFTSDKTSPISLMKDENILITFTANSGRFIDSIQVRNENGFTMVNKRDIASETFIYNEQTETGEVQPLSMTINVRTIEKPEEPKFMLVQDLVNCTSDVTDGEYPVGKFQPITFTSNEGYVLEPQGTIELTPPNTDPNPVRPFETGGGVTFTMNDFTPEEDTTIHLRAIKPEYVSNTSLINLYLANNDVLSKVASARYLSSAEVTDLGTYIINIFKAPFALPESMLENVDKIELATHEINVKTQKINGDSIIIDLGNIEVPEKYENAFDYLNTTCELFVPFTNSISVPVEFVMNKTTSISMRVSLLTGDTTITLTNSDGLYLTSDTNVFSNVPFIQYMTKETKTNLNNRKDNGVESPFILISRNTPLENVLGYECNYKGNLKDVQGYTEISTINIIGNVPQSEQDKIERLLSQGVFIK